MAPRGNATDAATYGRLNGVSQQVNEVGSVANKGVAMSMAQAAAGGLAVGPGQTSMMAMESGYFQCETAVGLGVAGVSKSSVEAGKPGGIPFEEWDRNGFSDIHVLIP